MFFKNLIHLELLMTEFNRLTTTSMNNQTQTTHKLIPTSSKTTSWRENLQFQEWCLLTKIILFQTTQTRSWTPPTLVVRQTTCWKILFQGSQKISKEKWLTQWVTMNVVAETKLETVAVIWLSREKSRTISTKEFQSGSLMKTFPLTPHQRLKKSNSRSKRKISKMTPWREN